MASSFQRPAGRGRVLAATTGVLLVCALPAHAASHQVAAWDSGWVTVSCEFGKFKRTCDYTYQSADCTEVSVVGVGTSCTAYLVARVHIVATLNDAGQVVGCATDPAVPSTGNFDYDSERGADAYDMTVQITMLDMFGDGKAGLLHYVGSSPSEQGVWTAKGVFETTCRAGYHATWVSAPGPGSVSVTV